MLSIILGFVTGLAGPIASLIGKIEDLKIAKLTAASNYDKAKIDQQVAEAEDRKAVLVAEAGNRLSSAITGGVRVLLALGPMALLLKIFLWDKVIGSFAHCAGRLGLEKGCDTFSTDKLDDNLWLVITAVIAFYFVYDMFARKSK